MKKIIIKCMIADKVFYLCLDHKSRITLSDDIRFSEQFDSEAEAIKVIEKTTGIYELCLIYIFEQ